MYMSCLIRFCLAAVCCSGLAIAQDRPVAALAFYNLENFFNPEDDPAHADEDFTPAGSHQYTEERFHQKAHNLATVLRQLGTAHGAGGASLIGVCEVEDDKALQLLLAQPELSGRKYRYIRFEGPDHRGIHVALLYRPSDFRLLQAQALPVDLEFAGGGATRDILLVRGILLGDTVAVLVNHWPSRSGGASLTAPRRAAAAAVCSAAIAAIRKLSPTTRIILMGDLNDDPVSHSVARVLGSTGTRSRLSGNLLYNPWVSFYRQGRGTLSHEDRWNLFDQILLSANWLEEQPGHLHFLEAEVFDRDFLKTVTGRFKGYPHRSYSGNRWINGYSDHFPTVIYFERR